MLVLAVLFVAAFVGGILNAVAGGGSFLALPALLFAGVPPVSANATTTFALWPGALASGFAYRHHLGESWSHVIALTVVSVMGGLFGAYLLIRTSDTSFMRLLPWLMLIASITFTFGGRLAERFARRNGGQPGNDLAHPIKGFPILGALFMFAIATYGGYFGGGMGIMMLAAMTLVGMEDIHEMNGLKSILAVAINMVAMIALVINGLVTYSLGFWMMIGGISGGYLGAAVARRLPGHYVRAFVILIGWTMTVYFFLRQS